MPLAQINIDCLKELLTVKLCVSFYRLSFIVQNRFINGSDYIEISHTLQTLKVVLSPSRLLRDNIRSMFMFPAQVNHHNNPSTKNLIQDLAPGNYVSLGVALLDPLLRGSAHITSANPSHEPHIDLRYLSHGLNVDV